MSKKKETVTEHGLGIISSVIVEHVKNEYGATFLRITPVNLDGQYVSFPINELKTIIKALKQAAGL